MIVLLKLTEMPTVQTSECDPDRRVCACVCVCQKDTVFFFLVIDLLIWEYFFPIVSFIFFLFNILPLPRAAVCYKDKCVIAVDIAGFDSLSVWFEIQWGIDGWSERKRNMPAGWEMSKKVHWVRIITLNRVILRWSEVVNLNEIGQNLSRSTLKV